jgi:hypothetical protein
MRDPMAMASSIMAMQGQAAQWLASTRAGLAAAGHGFSPEDLRAFEASRAAHPVPEAPYQGGQAGLEADAAEVARRAMEAEYPEGGFQPDDPRLAPVEGVTLAMAAIAAKLVGWSTDPADIARAARGLGVDVAVYERAADAWRTRVQDDVVLAAFYGQLYAQA